MNEFKEYAIIEQLEATSHAIVYRARKQGESQTVIIKALNATDPSPAQVARFRHEYELIRALTSDGIVRVLDILEEHGRPALVMEDFEAVSLKAHLQTGMALAVFLDLAARIAETLGHIHQQNITHRDVKPANILYDRENDILKLTDFGIAAEITRKNEEVYNPAVIEGTLAYMSPEQTGRINCPVDYRSDLYSLGITFYEMLTGGVPFMARDPLAVIHAHIAKTPTPPNEVNPKVPSAVADIVMKLLAKAPEERYQNALGLMADLKQALRQLQNTGRIDPFELARYDISLKFNIPQVIVGREASIAEINRIFDRTAAGAAQLLLVTGEPGIGKSTVVNEMRKVIVGKRGNFISGKYDQLRKSVPYSAIIQAFQGLVLGIHAEGGAQVLQWREKLSTALGDNGRIITDAIAEVELIIGAQPEIEVLGPEESQNRFNLVFKNFVRVFAAPEHPLVLLLDDLQWADAASLNLIRAIATDRAMCHFLFIGVYRDNEVPAHHPLMLTLEEIRKSGVEPHTHRLVALKLEDVQHLLTNFLHCDPEGSTPLAQLIHAKTLGNPFFMNQFLKTLYEERHLYFDVAVGWRWDMAVIRAMRVTDNVVELMAAKLARLPQDCLDLIKVCACVGNRFEMETLASVTGRGLEEILSIMDELISHGLINFSGNIYRFQHDRIQEAAYSLINDDDRCQFHYRIGTSMLATTPAEELAAKVFYIADQFNQAQPLIQTRQERDRVADLNFKAGTKAKEATAYATAAGYLQAGLALLGDDAWSAQYELTYGLHLECMECEYLNRRFAESEQLFAEINRHARDKIDRSRAYGAMIVLYNNIGKLEEAIALGVECMKLFNVRLSKDASKIAVLRELIRFKIHLKKIGIENIADLPMMDDEEKTAIFELITRIGLPAYFTNPNLFAVTVLKPLNMSLGHGLTYGSAFVLGAAATIIGSTLGDYQTAHRIIKVALNLNDKLGKKRYACKVNLVYGYLILHWLRPLKESIAVLRKGYQLGLDAGDFIYAGHCVAAMSGSRLINGDNIDEVLADHARFRAFIDTAQDPAIEAEYEEVQQALLNLKGLTESPFSISSEGFDQDAHMAAIRERGSVMNIFFRLLIMERIHYLYGDHEAAYQLGFELDTLLDAPKGACHLPEHLFYRCLSLTAVYPNKPRAEQKRILRTLKKMRKKMRKLARSCPENYLAKYLLIEAESAAISGASQESAESYQKAYQTAHEHGPTHVEALAHERAALFYMGRGIEFDFQSHLKMAHTIYRRWGATAKVREMEKAYPHLMEPEARRATVSDTHTTTGTSTTGLSSSLLDLSTVVKVSQAISGEIMLDRLLSKIMTMAVQNAGAQRGFFILDTDGRLTIEAALEEANEVKVMQSIPLDGCDKLSVPIVKYVHKKAESVILGSAATEGTFRRDPYVARQRCKSILCMPILHKGKLSGLLYLENNLTQNAFTQDRLELLHLFLSQAAIALENARLFELATTDGMTKLFVHRYFQLLLDQEISRSMRYDRPFALIMADIDNFKHFNDTYGHQLGDEVLKRVAGVMRKNMRTQDMAARYGGEEFALILPETDTNSALDVAEKVRTLVAAVEIPQGDQMLHVTISLGIATFPFHADDKQALIGSADGALYASKRAGKNRTTVGVRINPHAALEN